MKKFNFLSKLWSSVAGSQRNDVEFDRRLTVGSPSGFTINWTLKLVSVLVLVLTIGIGNVWGAVNNGDLFERVSSIAAKDEVIFVNSGEGVAMSTTQNSNNRGVTSITVDKTNHWYVYNSTDNVQVLTVSVNSSKYSFYTVNGSSTGYLRCPSNNNYLRTYNTLENSTKWTYTVSSNAFTILNVAQTSRYIAYNSTNSIFSTYTSGQSKPYLYKKVMSAPTAVAASSITSSGATITITDATNVNNYELYYSTSSTAPTASTAASTTITSGKSIALTGLSGGTKYYLWARAFSTSPARKTGWVALSGSYFTTTTPTYNLYLVNSCVAPALGSYSSNKGTSGSGTGVYAGCTKYSGIAAGTSVTITASPTSGYVFDGWTDGGYSIIMDDESNEITPSSTTSTTATFTMPSSDVVIWQCNFSAESCTAPHHVDVGSQWDWFKGETLTLSATAYSTSGSGSPISAGDITAYQWYKGGTADGNKIAGATNATYTKSNCTLDDAGDYYCKVSTGSSCHTMSSAFGVKIYALEGYTGSTTQYNFTRIGSTQTGSVQIDLAANSSYQFKVRQGGSYYGNNGTIAEDENTWTFTSGGGNVTVNTYTAGKFTFTLDYSSNATEPILAVTYPARTLYLQLCSDWKAASAKYAIYYWRTATGWSEDFMTATTCDADILYASIPSWAQYVIFGRFNPSKGSTGNWDNKYNQTSNQTLAYNKDYLYSLSGSGDAYTGTWGTYSPATYSITFAGNGNTSGSMTNVTGIPCGEDRTLAANGYVKTGYNFNKWETNVAITVGGAAVAANGLVADKATINNIASNITLTAQWTAKTTTVSFNQNGGTGGQTSSLTATYGSAMPTPITKPTKDHYTFEGYYDGSGGTGTKYYNADGTSARNWDKEGSTATLYAKWTAVNYTVTWYAGGTGSENITTAGSPSTSVAYNSKVATLPSTPSGSACDLTFIGWTNTTTYTHGTSTLFTTAAGSPAVTSATKYYAVFAAGSAPATKNLTNSQIQTFHSADATNHGSYAKGPFTITSTDGNWYGVFCSQNNGGVYTANLKSDNVTIDATTYRPFLQSPVYSNDIASVTITHNVTTDRTLLICSSASADPAKDKIASISITSSNQSGVSANIPSGVKQIYLYSSSSGIMLKSIAVSVGGYSGHTLTCEACATSVTSTFTASPEGGTVAVSKSGAPVSSGTAVKTCGGVALAVTITPDSHHKLTNFTATGLTTGTATISPSVATTLATPQASAQTFTVTLSDGAEGTLNLTPTFSENAYRTVVFVNNNTKLFDDNGEATTFDATNKWKQKVYVGEKPVLPTALIASQACDDNSTTFMGWVRDNQRWPGKSASSMPAGSTLITAASGFDAAAAGSGEIAYHAVWAQSNLESDVIDRSATSSKLGSTSTSSWVSAWDLTGSTGAKYTISMGTSGGTQALQWNSSGYLYCKTAPTSGKKLFSIAVTGTDSKNVGLYGNGSAYSANSGGTNLGTLATGSTYTFSASYGYIRITGTASSTQITRLTITYGSYTNYMTTCCASTGLTLEGPTGDMVFITSSSEKKVRSQEAFHISGCGVSGSQTLTFDFGSSALNAKFTCATATGGALVTTCDGRIDEDFYIYYTPGAGDTDDGIDQSTSLTASVAGSLSANTTLSTKTIIGRHLPADFVIAGKKNGKWYALPATMESTDHPEPVEIAVDDANNPSTAYTIASNKYGLEGPAAGNISDGDGQYVKLTMHPLSDAPLFGQAPSNTGIGKSGTAVATNKLSAGWWWKLEQINTSITNPQDAKYTIYCANNTSSLSIKDNAGNPEWGLYASGVDELRLIPVNAIEFTESEVVAWGQEKLILEVALPVGATQARAKLGDGSWSANKSLATTTGTSVNGTATKYNYTLDFTDEIDFSDAGSEGKMLVVELLNSGGTALKATSVLIPKIVAANRTIKKATDATKGPWDTEVHVLPGVTLTIDASGYSPADMTIAELNIYPGATVVAENGKLKATTLILRNGWDRLSATKKYDVARLFITSSTGSLQTATAYSDWYIDFDQYYPIAVPWSVSTSAMTYKNTTSAASAGVKMRYYDGASRASNVQNGVGESENWKVYDVDGKAYPATLTPGIGYAMTAKRPVGKAFSIVRMPLTIPSAEWTNAGEKGEVSDTHKDQVSVTAHGDENTPVYAKGWNFIANPYMSLYQGALSYTEGGGAIEYANIPDENFKEFDQQPILTTKLKPSSAFLIKAPTTGVATFATANRKASAPQRYSNEASESEMQIQRAYILLGDDQTEDMMGILVGEKYTADYELNADLEKLLSDGNTLRTYMRYNDMNMAYLAINEELAKQLIPVSVRIPADGEYTFRIHEASIADELEGIYLTDYQANTVTNLLYDSYTFNAVAGTDNVRFAINAVIGKREVPTGVDISGSDKDRPTKFIWNDKVYILHNNVIYDSTGKRVNVINK